MISKTKTKARLSKISVILKSIIYLTSILNIIILIGNDNSLVEAQTRWPNHPPKQTRSSRQADNQTPAIFINPNSFSRSQIENKKLTAGSGSGGRRSIGDQIGSTPSSIGKHERNQVAEWPFFKSLQSARNNYNADRYFELLLDAKKSLEQPPAQRSSKSAIKPEGSAPQMNSRLLTGAAINLDSAERMTSSGQDSTTTTTTSTTTTTTTTTTSTSTTTEAPEVTSSNISPMNGHDDSGVTSAETMEAEMDAEVATTPSPNTTSSMTTITSTTTEAPMTSSESPSSSEDPKMVIMDDRPPQMFAPVIHSSIQQAVDRIVNKMVTAKQLKANSNPDKPLVVTEMAAQPAKASSMSLNVLLKHFGLHNLTDFDHLLLRQRPKMADSRVNDDPETIHLEIKPIKVDSDCISKNKSTNSLIDSNQKDPIQPVEMNGNDPNSEHDSNSTVNYVEAPSSDNDNPMPQLVGRSLANGSHRRVNGAPPAPVTQPKRKFVLKVQPENELHPLNNRFKVSQTFDVNSVKPALYNSAPMSQTEGQVSSHKQPQEEFKLCDGFQHYTTVGQLTTPDYPRFYSANVHCSFIIKRASINHCKLMLQFRDFDLINDKSDQRQQQQSINDKTVCQNDYLQIGETRYCNRYAMIGHKMKLDFPLTDLASDSNVKLTFHSDHMQSGRGFLIKYQQLPCDDSSSQIVSNDLRSSNNQRQSSANQLGDQSSTRQTVAPPLQQPDFSLALKTTPTKPEIATSAPVKKTKAEQTKPTVEATSGSNQKMRQQTTSKAMNQTNSSNLMTPMASTTSNFLSLSQPQSGSFHVDSFAKSTPKPNESNQMELPRSSMECNQINDEMSFILRSVNYPDPYANNLECLYYIKRNNSRVCYVELTFIKFDLEADSDCRYDYLEINNVRLCGSLKDLAHKTTRIYLFNEPIKVIKFKSDSIGAKSGFFIRADQLECAANGSIMRQAKQLQAPGENFRDRNNETISDVLQDSQPKLTSNLGSGSRRSNEFNMTTFRYDTNLNQRQSTIEATSQSDSNSPRVSPSNTGIISPQQPTNPKADSANLDPSFACNDILYGKEITIKSPHWPESYASDETINTCKYTIIRSTIGKNKICQLELRFINLRLGVSDCIDINGYELLCGFNTRNLVKYYPFDRQNHITVTFLSGGSFTSKLARSMHSTGGPQNHSDLLPTRAPLRFMIIARQHECIDGFLAPQVELSPGYNQANLLYSSTGHLSGPNSNINNNSNGPRYVNRTSPVNDNTKTKVTQASKSLISNQSTSRDSTLMYSFPNYTSNNNLGANNQAKPQNVNCLDESVKLTNDQIFTKNYPIRYELNSHCTLTIPRQSHNICHLELELLDMDLDSSSVSSGICDSDYVQFNYGERYCNMQQIDRRLGPKRILTLPFNRADDYKATITFKSDAFRVSRGFLIRHRQVDCVELLQQSVSGQRLSQPDNSNLAPTSSFEKKLIGRISLVANGNENTNNRGDSSDRPMNLDPTKCSIQFSQYNGILSSFNILSNMRTNYPATSECELKFKLLPGFCQIQLSFSRFELTPRLGSFCLEYLELANVQYCGQELKNATKMLSMTEPRSVSLRFSSSNSSNFYGFRAVSKQIECDPEPLKPLGSPKQVSSLSNDRQSGISDQQVVRPQQAEDNNQPKRDLFAPQQQVDFKEVPIKSEFFELNSGKISKSTNTYDANMFVVYRIKKVTPEVCKLRLMFYRFDIESSPGCKRDFLDVDNVDRLCGVLGKPEDTRRDYDWSSERDLLISFVSDNNIQREGFLLFGQQLEACNSANSSVTTNEHHSTSTTTTQATPITTMTPTGGSIMGATFDEEPIKTDYSPVHSHQNRFNKNEQSSKTTTASLPSNETNCSSVHYETSFELASPNWPQRYNSRAMCFYLIHKSQPDICSITFNVVSMILDTDDRDPISCDTSGSDHIDIDGQLLCGLISRPRVIHVDFNQRQFITARFNSIAATGFGFFIEAKQHKCQTNAKSDARLTNQAPYKDPPVSLAPKQTDSMEVSSETPVDHSDKSTNQSPGGNGCNQLFVGEVSVIESENFPSPYANNQECLYAIRRTNQSVCAIDVTMNYFELEDSNPFTGSCENDYIEIDYSRFCGTYPTNHRLKFNYFDQELDKFIRFRSDSTNARAGYSLTINQVMDSCQQEEEPAKQQQVVRNRDNNRASDEIISYLPDSSTASSSTTSRHPPTLTETAIHSANTSTATVAAGRSGEVTSTLCQFVYHAEHQYLLSPNYNEQRRTYDNNIDCMYKISAKSYDFCSLKLHLIDVDLEQSSGCHNDYILIDNQRYCGQHSNETSNQTMIQLQFSENTPREIHLLYHTNAHLNSGRGFKIQYEQVPCATRDESQTSKSSSAAERQARRSHFGQLSYPKNYVSVSSATPSRSTSPHNNGKPVAKQRDEQMGPPLHRSRDQWNSHGHRIVMGPKEPVQLPSSEDTMTEDSTIGGSSNHMPAAEMDSADLTIHKEIVVVKNQRNNNMMTVN